LSGINTFGGALNIQQGTLQISAAPNDANTDGVLGNSATSVSLGNVGGLTATVLYALSSPGSTNRNFTMVTGGTGDFNVSGNLTLSGVIDGGGNLTKTVNTGTLQFSGSASNSYGGLTTVSAGTLLLGKSGAAQAIAGGGLTINSGVLVQYNGTSTDMMGTGAVTINGSAQLDFNGANDTIGNVTIAASGAGADTTPLKNTAGGGSLTIGTLGITPVAGFTSVLNAGSGGTLTLGGTVTFTAATTGRARITGTTLALGGDRIFNIGLGTGIGFDLEISSAISGSGNSLTKQGTGRLLLSGANSYTGATTISAGTVTVTNAAAFNPSTGGAVSMATGTTLNYIASTDAQLGLHSPRTITGGVGTVLGTSLGATATSAEINVTGAATATGSVTVNFYPVGNTLAGGIYTLVHGGAGSSLNGATYALGTIYNNTNWTASGLGATATDLTVAISTVTPLTTAYWKGGLAGATNVWAVSNGSSSNWAATAGGVAQALVPGAGADVIISATTPTTAPTATFLGANMSIQSLTIADLINGLGLNADGTTLTLGTGGLTMNANVPASTIAANVILGGNQTWTNSSSNGLTMSGVVSGASNLIKTGTGTVTLSGTNSFTGSISIAGGVLSISSDGHLGNIANGISLAAGGTLRFGSAATLTAARLITVNGSVGNPSGLSLGSSVTQILGASQLTGSGVAKVSLTGGTTPGILSMEGVNAGFTGNMIVGAPGEFVGQFFFLARFWDQRRCDAASAKCRHAGQREQPDDQ
jgi:autotransporter-associated beta strand protein